jgi:hypothetical protein
LLSFSSEGCWGAGHHLMRRTSHSDPRQMNERSDAVPGKPGNSFDGLFVMAEAVVPGRGLSMPSSRNAVLKRTTVCVVRLSMVAGLRRATEGARCPMMSIRTRILSNTPVHRWSASEFIPEIKCRRLVLIWRRSSSKQGERIALFKMEGTLPVLNHAVIWKRFVPRPSQPGPRGLLGRGITSRR